MYKITFIRSGRYPKLNYKLRGEFTKEFQNLDDAAKFLFDSRPRLCVKSNNLSRAERYIFNKKYMSLDWRDYVQKKSVV